jgi:hypothetical protein
VGGGQESEGRGRESKVRNQRPGFRSQESVIKDRVPKLIALKGMPKTQGPPRWCLLVRRIL